MSAKTPPPSLLGNAGSSAAKPKSLLDSLDAPRSGYRSTSNAYSSSVASNQWFIWLMVITLAAAAMFYLFQPLEQSQKFTPPVNGLPISFASNEPEPQAEADFNIATADIEKQLIPEPSVTQGTEQEAEFVVVESTAAKIEDISDSQEDIQMAFASLEKAEPKVKTEVKAKLKPKTQSTPKQTSKAKTTTKPSTKLAQKSVQEAKATIKAKPSAKTEIDSTVTAIARPKNEVDAEPDDADVAVISAMLGHYMGVGDGTATPEIANVRAIKTPSKNVSTELVEVDAKSDSSSEIEKKIVASKEKPVIDVVEKDAQIKGAMDISMMAGDPAALALEECSTKNFVQKPYCEWKVCSDYRGKSPLCPSSQKEPKQATAEITPEESVTETSSNAAVTEESTDIKAGKATTEITDHVTQEAKTMATNKTKEKASSALNKQFDSMMGGK